MIGLCSKCNNLADLYDGLCSICKVESTIKKPEETVKRDDGISMVVKEIEE